MEDSVNNETSQVPVKKKRNWLAIFFLILFLFALGAALSLAGIVYRLSGKNNGWPSIVASPSPVPGQTDQWLSYENNFYGLKLKYPRGYSLAENSNFIEISSPLSKCSPKLIFNLEEYEGMHELQIFLKERDGFLKEVLESEGGEAYGWEKINLNGRESYHLVSGAEMITPVEKYLVEIQSGKVLAVESHYFASDDLGNCTPKLEAVRAAGLKDEIILTFKPITEALESYKSVYTGLSFDYPKPFGSPMVSYDQYGDTRQESVKFETDKDTFYIAFNKDGVQRGGLIQGVEVSPTLYEYSVSRDGHKFKVTAYSLVGSGKILIEAATEDLDGKELLYMKTLTPKPENQTVESLELFHEVVRSMDLGV